tara:strand:+ start:75 stop:641 length:567 start_codon:yes stop_codon:yes gene_type:complete
MIKIKNLTLAIIGSIMIIGCGNSKKDEENKTVEVQTETEPKNENLKSLEREASRLRAGGSIKTVELDNGIANIEYVKDYAEYKKLNPQSGLDKSSWETYWETSDGVEKAIVDGSVKLMKKLDFLNEVKITIPYKGKTYSVDVKKSELEKFVGSDFKTIVSDWDNKFSNPYVYNDSGRQKFFAEFGSTE